MSLELGLYKHYKGKIYEVLGTVRHSETLEDMVLYKATYQLDENNLWVRPKKMFEEMVLVDGKMMKRFQKI